MICPVSTCVKIFEVTYKGYKDSYVPKKDSTVVKKRAPKWQLAAVERHIRKDHASTSSLNDIEIHDSDTVEGEDNSPDETSSLHEIVINDSDIAEGVDNPLDDTSYLHEIVIHYRDIVEGEDNPTDECVRDEHQSENSFEGAQTRIDETNHSSLVSEGDQSNVNALTQTECHQTLVRSITSSDVQDQEKNESRIRKSKRSTAKRSCANFEPKKSKRLKKK